MSRDLVKKEAEAFPAQFNLRNHGEKLFRISERDSYFSPEFEGNDWAPPSKAHVKLYLEILNQDGQWRSYCKTTSKELMGLVRR